MKNYFWSFLLFTSFLILVLVHPGKAAKGNSERFIRKLVLDHVVRINSYTQSVIEDNEGFLWFGTTSGIFKYDGYTLTNYNPSNAAISSSDAPTLFKDSHNLIWIGTVGKGVDVYDKNKDRFINYRHYPGDPQSISSNSFEYKPGMIAEDKDGDIWLGTQNGLNRYDRESDKFERFTSAQGLSHNFCWAVMVDRADNVWIGTKDGLNRYDKKTREFTVYRHDRGNPGSLSGNEVMSVFEDTKGTIWIGTRKSGINALDVKNGLIKRFKHHENDPYSLHENGGVTSFVEDNQGRLWIGRYYTHSSGIEFIERDNEIFHQFKKEDRTHFGLRGNTIMDYLIDRSGNMWIVDNSGFIDKYNPNAPKIELYRYDNQGEHALDASLAYSLAEDTTGDIWFGTLDRGIARYRPYTEQFSYYPVDRERVDALHHPFAFAVFVDIDGTLWAGTADGHLSEMEKETGKVLQRYKNPYSQKTPRQIVDDPYDKQVLWFGTVGDGLFRFNKESGLFRQYVPNSEETSAVSSNVVTRVLVDGNQKLWFGTGGGGLMRYNHETDDFTIFHHDPGSETSISVYDINDIFIDNKDNFWVATDKGGLNKFDRDTQTFEKVNAPFPSETHLSIIEDDQGFLWIATENGLTQFDPEQMQIVMTLDSSGELHDNRYIKYGCNSLKTKDGDLWFTGIKGVTRFSPETIRANHYLPPVYITALYQGGTPKHTGLATEKLKHIFLPWDMNFFEFEMAALNYTYTEKNQYKYFLEGFDKNWFHSGQRRFGRYSNLPGGDYTLRIRASNNHNLWGKNEFVLSVTVDTPFWKSRWFFSLIACLVLFVIVMFTRLQLKARESRLIAEQQAALSASAQREKEAADAANQAKSLFLANMSHELRTPLNAVLGFSEILYYRVLDPKNKKYLKSIRTSGKSLLSLVNDILDFSKIEAGKMELNPQAVSIRHLGEEMASIFQHRISDKGVRFQIDVDENLPEALLLDENRMRQVLINLLSNAAKFTDEGFVRLSYRRKTTMAESESTVDLIIEVADTGQGIARDAQERIFNAFEQVTGRQGSPTEGTGLGLAITHSIVHLMNGTISVESEKDTGTTFTVELPDVEIVAGVEKDGTIDRRMGFNPDLIRFDPSKILIVDDIEYNRDVLAAYLELSNITQCFAADGEQAIEKTQTEHPDLILMDMKMPNMDGLEASRRLKESPETQGIPIIAVTASVLKQDEEKVKQYCDGYLRKPISQITLINEIKKFLKYTEEAPVIEDAETEFVTPAETDLIVMYEIAKDGDMDEVTAHLDQLEEKDIKLKPFCDEIRTLALGYEYEKIIRLTKIYMKKAAEDTNGKGP